MIFKISKSCISEAASIVCLQSEVRPYSDTAVWITAL